MSLSARITALAARIGQELRNLFSPLFTSNSSIVVPYSGTTIERFRMQRVGRLVTIQMRIRHASGGSTGIGEIVSAWRPQGTTAVVGSATGTSLHGEVYATSGTIAMFSMPASASISVTISYLLD